MDASIVLPGGAVLAVVRLGATADRTGFAKRLWRLREGPAPGGVLLLAPTRRGCATPAGCSPRHRSRSCSPWSGKWWGPAPPTPPGVRPRCAARSAWATPSPTPRTGPTSPPSANPPGRRSPRTSTRPPPPARRAGCSRRASAPPRSAPSTWSPTGPGSPPATWPCCSAARARGCRGSSSPSSR